MLAVIDRHYSFGFRPWNVFQRPANEFSVTMAWR